MPDNKTIKNKSTNQKKQKMVNRTKESMKYVILPDGCRERVIQLCPICNFEKKRIIQELTKDSSFPEYKEKKIQQKIYNIIKYERSLHKRKTNNSKENKLVKKNSNETTEKENLNNTTPSKLIQGNEKQYELKLDCFTSEIQKYIKEQINHLIFMSFVEQR